MDAVPDLIHCASDRCILCPTPLLFNDNIAVSREIVAGHPSQILNPKCIANRLCSHWLQLLSRSNRSFHPSLWQIWAVASLSVLGLSWAANHYIATSTVPKKRMPSPWSSSSCHVFSPRLLQFIAPTHGPYCTALPSNDAGHLEIGAIDTMVISTRLEESWKTQSLSCFCFMFWFNPSSIWVKLIQLGLGALSFALKATARVTGYGSRPFLEIPIFFAPCCFPSKQDTFAKA